MRHKQLALLFVCYCIPPFIGMGLFPLLPLYATQFGATRTVVGFSYAAMYAASLLGTLITGWLGPRVPRKGVFVAGAALGVPAVALLGQATALWQVTCLTSLVWFCASITLTLISVATAAATDSRSRGKAFALLALAFPLDGLFGGMVTGYLVSRYGFPFMFLVLGAIWAALPIIGLFGFPEPQPAPPASEPRGVEVRTDRAPGSFRLLMLSSLVTVLGISISRLSLPLSMQELGFSVSALASTATMSGAATIPLVIVLGTLSDRLGHRHVLRLSPILGIGGATMLILARELWQFQLGASLLTLATAINGSIGAALAATLLPPGAMGRYLPRFHAMDSTASIIGFGCAGLLLDRLGGAGVYGVAAMLVALALPLLGPLPVRVLVRRARPASPGYSAARALTSAAVVDNEVCV